MLGEPGQRRHHRWLGHPADVPTPFGLFPTDLNPTDVFNALVQGIPEGISKAIADIKWGQWTDYSSLQGLLGAAQHVRPHPQ